MIGPNGLRCGHVITHLNGCEVKSKTDYLKCLSRYEVNIPKYGYYIPESDVIPFTANSDRVTVIRGETACCQEFENITSASHICFQYHNPKKSQSSTGVISSQGLMSPTEFEDVAGIHRANRANFGNLPKTTNEINKFAGDINREEFSFACLPGKEVTDHSPCDEYELQKKVLFNSFMILSKIILGWAGLCLSSNV